MGRLLCSLFLLAEVLLVERERLLEAILTLLARAHLNPDRLLSRLTVRFGL